MSNAPQRNTLLVEDKPDDCKLEIRALGKANLSDPVQVAHNGTDASEYLFGEGPDAARNLNDIPKIIMVDLKLPGIDGLEVLRPLRADSRATEMPVAPASKR